MTTTPPASLELRSVWFVISRGSADGQEPVKRNAFVSKDTATQRTRDVRLQVRGNPGAQQKLHRICYAILGAERTKVLTLGQYGRG